MDIIFDTTMYPLIGHRIPSALQTLVVHDLSLISFHLSEREILVP